MRKRIASYMRLAGHSTRIARMIALTASMVFVSTKTETEALLLETNFIKQMKPRFNVLMRDDKSFPYISLTGDLSQMGSVSLAHTPSVKAER